jgi:hypothetical protein
VIFVSNGRMSTPIANVKERFTEIRSPASHPMSAESRDPAPLPSRSATQFAVVFSLRQNGIAQ